MVIKCEKSLKLASHGEREKSSWLSRSRVSRYVETVDVVGGKSDDIAIETVDTGVVKSEFDGIGIVVLRIGSEYLDGDPFEAIGVGSSCDRC
jgi:hypothetical protein